MNNNDTPNNAIIPNKNVFFIKKSSSIKYVLHISKELLNKRTYTKFIDRNIVLDYASPVLSVRLTVARTNLVGSAGCGPLKHKVY